jgi:hypothetical protein
MWEGDWVITSVPRDKPYGRQNVRTTALGSLLTVHTAHPVYGTIECQDLLCRKGTSSVKVRPHCLIRKGWGSRIMTKLLPLTVYICKKTCLYHMGHSPCYGSILPIIALRYDYATSYFTRQYVRLNTP